MKKKKIGKILMYSFYIFLLLISLKFLMDFKSYQDIKNYSVTETTNYLDKKIEKSQELTEKEQKEQEANQVNNQKFLEKIENDITKIKKDVEITEEIEEDSPLILSKSTKNNKIGRIVIPTLALNIPIFDGTNNYQKDGDNMLIGAVAQKYGSKMGLNNYVLASHIINGSDLLFTNIHKLRDNNAIYLYDDTKIYKYLVYDNFVVKQTDVQYLKDVKDLNILTLYTCYYQKNGDKDRTIVRALLVDILEQ